MWRTGSSVRQCLLGHSDFKMSRPDLALFGLACSCQGEPQDLALYTRTKTYAQQAYGHTCMSVYLLLCMFACHASTQNLGSVLHVCLKTTSDDKSHARPDIVLHKNIRARHSHMIRLHIPLWALESGQPWVSVRCPAPETWVATVLLSELSRAEFGFSIA